jgi:hypothetical protein
MSEVAKAQNTLSELNHKREQAVADAHKLGEERARIAFQAHTGDKGARKRLDEINRSIGTHESEIVSIDAAIAEATARVQQAKHAEAKAADRQAALELRAAVKELRSAGLLVDQALAALVDASDAMSVVIDVVHSLGVSHPHHQQVLTFGERVIRTALQKTMWNRGFEHLPPNERQSFAPICDGWARSLENNIAQRLGDAPAKAKETVTNKA